MVYIIFLPICYCQWAWIKVVELFPATIASIGTLLIPVLGVFSSALVLGERIGLQEILALVLVLIALMISLIRPKG
jgi:drug/metabolite transporter (DMT)-like permease